MPAAPDLRAMMKRSRRLVGEPHDVSHKLDFKTLRPAQVNDLLRASEWRYSRRLVTLLSQWSTAHYTAFTPAEAGYFTNRLLTCPVPWEAGIRFADRYADLTRTWRFSRIKEQTQYSEVVDLVCGVSRLLIKHGRLPSALLFAAYLCAYMQKRRTVERLAGPPLVRLFALLTEFEESIRRSRPMTEAHQDDVRKMLAPGFKRDVFARIEQNLAGTSRWHPMGIGPDSARLLLRKLGPEHLDGAGKALGRLLAAGVEGASEAQVLAMLRGLALRGLGMYPVFQGLLDPLLEALAQRLAFAARGVFTLLRDCRVPRSHRVWDAATRTHNAATVGGLVPADFLDDALAEELVARCLRDPVHDYNTGTCQFLMSFHRFLPPVEASKVIIQYLYQMRQCGWLKTPKGVRDVMSFIRLMGRECPKRVVVALLPHYRVASLQAEDVAYLLPIMLNTKQSSLVTSVLYSCAYLEADTAKWIAAARRKLLKKARSSSQHPADELLSISPPLGQPKAGTGSAEKSA